MNSTYNKNVSYFSALEHGDIEFSLVQELLDYTKSLSLCPINR